MFGLEDTEHLAAIALRKKISPQLFNPSSEKTSSVKSRLKSFVKETYDSKCAVCGVTENVTVCHLLKTKGQCDELGVAFDATNFICLCGCDGMKGTCHDNFDKDYMSFIYCSGARKWAVVGGPYHGKLIDLPSNPRKRVLHSHFARCVLNQSLVNVVDTLSEIDFEISDDSDD